MQKTLWQAPGLASIITIFPALLSVLALLWPAQAQARDDPAHICDRAASLVASETIVPLEVLRATTRTGTGHGASGGLDMWPWSVNMPGRSIWFDTQEQARIYVFRHFKRGVRSFDVGCFQVNYSRYGHTFASIEDMFDPVLNARSAAKHLGQLHEIHGDWPKAVSAYKTRTHSYSKRYLQQVIEVRAKIGTVIDAIGGVRPRHPGPANPHKVNPGSLMLVFDWSGGTPHSSDNEG